MANDRLRRSSSRALARTVVIAVVSGFGAILAYEAFYGWCVLHEDNDTVYFPFVTSGKVAGMIDQAGGRVDAIHRYGAWALKDAIGVHPVSLALTSGLLAILYGTISVALSTALLVPAMRLDARTDSRGN